MNTSRTQEQPLEQDLTAAWRYRKRPQPPRYDFADLLGDNDCHHDYHREQQPPGQGLALLSGLLCLIFCIAGAACWLWMALEPVFEHVERMLR